MLLCKRYSSTIFYISKKNNKVNMFIFLFVFLLKIVYI